MNDFLNGWSQGMTGNTNGLPSQSVMEAMGRDAARNQWHNNNPHSGGPSNSAQGPASSPGVPITKALYEIGLNISGRKLLRDYAIALGLIVLGGVIAAILPPSLEWAAAVPSVPGYIFLVWSLLCTPLFIIARIGKALKRA